MKNSRREIGVSASALWRRYGRLRYEALPAPVCDVAAHCLLDWFGCALAGSSEPLVQILRDEMAAVPGPCALIGSTQATTATNAALINGAAGHALDYDDTSMQMVGHPTAPVLPALLALAQERGASGKVLLTALVVGVQVETLLGRAIGIGHYRRGWHVTATIGVFGAAAGAAHLMGLDETRFGHALGIAASQSSGLKANFGTMTKPLHAGQAAERGLLAARLAARGFTANGDAFAGKQGLMEAAGDGPAGVSPALAGEQGGERWAIVDTLFKHHASCHLTHAAIEATTALRARLDGALLQAQITVNPALLDVCAIASPTTGLEGKFSLAATAAMAWLGVDTGDPASFVDGTIQREDLQRLLDRVEIRTDADLTLTAATVAIQTDAGQQAWESRDVGVPVRDLAAQ
ncbi:MAG: MmgE/PrpD family protein, partial [Salinisphaera sp.]|nr:MmgE/PrpD family protein [Salinisphaera sp.]